MRINLAAEITHLTDLKEYTKYVATFTPSMIVDYKVVLSSVIRCAGYCTDCETDCIGAAFKERMPGIELIRY